MSKEVKAQIVEDIDDCPRKAGMIQYSLNAEGIFFICPCGCGKESYISIAKDPDKAKALKREKDPSWAGAIWGWDGNKEEPTLTPSIHSHTWNKKKQESESHWHGWLQKGLWHE